MGQLSSIGERTMCRTAICCALFFVVADVRAQTAPVPRAAGQLAVARDAVEQGEVATNAAAEPPRLSPLATEGPKPKPVVPPTPEELSKSIERGVKFLLADQRPDGAWGSAEKSKSMNLYAPPPGSHDAFRAATTSLAVLALIESSPHVRASERPAVERAIDRGASWLEQHLSELKRATPDVLYNVWGHAYAIQCLVALHERAAGDTERQATYKELAQHQAEMLARYSYVGGGWSYYDFLAGTQTPGDAAFSFSTASVLLALKDGEKIGVEFPERLTKKAIASLLRQQKPDFSYAYGEYLRMQPMLPINVPAGSLGRSQTCNLALRKCGDRRITDEVLKTWLDRLFARNDWLSFGRKRPLPHESHFQVSGYFYYYGHWYAALCIDELPAAERPHFQDHMAHILLPLQEKDGSWWDYPLFNYHQQYGTAMALMTLVRCQHN